jgi:hypothetical protein
MVRERCSGGDRGPAIDSHHARDPDAPDSRTFRIEDPVKATAGQGERAWDVVTGALTFAGAGGAAALAAGAAIPPIAPIVAVVRAPGRVDHRPRAA